MALDNNHVTKLGELKQLIDGLWNKVTTAISNAVSGLLSKSEADASYQAKGSYATQSELNSLGNSLSGSIGSINAKIPSNASETNKLAAASDIPDVSGFETLQHAESTYAKKGEIPSTDNFAAKDGSNASGTWGKYSEGIDSHYTELSSHTYAKIGTLTGNYNIYAGVVFSINIRQNNARNDVGILTIRKYEYGNGAPFGNTDNTSNFIVLAARNATTSPRVEFYTVSSVSNSIATIDIYFDSNAQLGISLLNCPNGCNWKSESSVVSAIPSNAEKVPSYRATLTDRISAVGSSSNPVYVAANGVVTSCNFKVV